MDMVNMTCEVIKPAVGFVYVILPAILNQTLRKDCEQSWYLEDRSLIADPSFPLRLIDPATAVKSDRLFTSRCVNLNHEIRCDSADGFHSIHEIMFKVRNETDVSGPTQTPGSHQLLWLFALLIIVLFTIILICFILRKRQLRCFQRDPRIVCQCDDDSEDRDPESAVVMI